MLEALAEPIETCVGRRDTRHAAFRGCIDWHSAVHGTWALIAIMRATGSDRYENLVRSRLREDLIARERALLAVRPGFEMPYGRAWFLRLAIDYEQHFADGLLTQMALETSDGLEVWLSAVPPKPWSGSYSSQSWAIMNLLAFARFRGDEPAIRRAKTFAERLIAQVDGPCPVEREIGHFMAICTNLAALAAEILPRDEYDAWLQVLMDRVELRPVTRAVNAHHLGLNFSRAWGLRAMAEGSSDMRWKDLYTAHIRASFDRPDHWNGDYYTSSHWVAQFGVYALRDLVLNDQN